MATQTAATDDVWSHLAELLPHTLALDFYAFGPKAMRLKIQKEKRSLDLNVSLGSLLSATKSEGSQTDLDFLRLFPALQELSICFDVQVQDTPAISLPHLRVLTVPTSCAEAVLTVLNVPSLDTLRLFHSPLQRPATHQIPFYFDPPKIGVLPPTLTRLDVPKSDLPLPGPITERLPNSISSLNAVELDFVLLEAGMKAHPPAAVINDSVNEADADPDARVSSYNLRIAENHPLRINCSIDLSEITSIEAAKEAIVLSINELKRRLSDATFGLQHAMAIIYYVVLPRTVDYYSDCASEDAQVKDIIAFMKHVQTLYDLVHSEGSNIGVDRSNDGANESAEKDENAKMNSIATSTVVLLPCAPMKTLPKIHLAVSLSMTQNHTSEDTVDAYDRFFIPVLSAQPASSSSSSRLSLASFDLADTVAVGGTFDYLHTGHRALLSACVLTTRKRLVVGVAVQGLLMKKSNKEYLQPYDTRRRNVMRFCALQRPDLLVDAVELLEPAGPTATDPSIELLVLSHETEPVFDSLCKLREEKGFPAMKCLVIPLASNTGELQQIAPSDAKVSSTTLRLRQRLIDEYIKSSSTD